MATTLTSCTDLLGNPTDNNLLPDYVTVNLKTHDVPTVLKTPAQTLPFPLTPEDRRDIKILEAKYDAEKNCAGLAAPQIGIAKQIIIFAVPDDPELRKWRKDLGQTMGKTIWVNPSYEPIGVDMVEDYEACFSVPEMAGPVKRYNQIRYHAYTVEGEKVEGTAQGFLARVIQHESDHIQGKLYIEYVPENQLIPMESYQQKRAEALQAE